MSTQCLSVRALQTFQGQVCPLLGVVSQRLGALRASGASPVRELVPGALRMGSPPSDAGRVPGGGGASGRPGFPLLPWEHVDSRWTGSTVCWVGLPVVKAREAAAAFCPADVGVGGVRRGRRALGSGDYGV